MYDKQINVWNWAWHIWSTMVPSMFKLKNILFAYRIANGFDTSYYNTSPSPLKKRMKKKLKMIPLMAIIITNKHKLWNI